MYHIENKSIGIENITGTNTTIGGLWKEINKIVNQEANTKNVIESDYIPYSEDESGNSYSMENILANKITLGESIQEIYRADGGKELSKYRDLTEKYSLQ